MRKTKQKKKNNNKNKPRRRATIPVTSGTVLRMPYNFPDTVITELRYLDSSLNRNNAGVSYCTWRYRLNSAYDPDPLLGTGGMSGFTEWAGIYTHYRITKMTYDILLSNEEAFPLLVVSAPTLTDLGANYSNIDQIPEFPYGKKTLLSASGGADRARLRGSVYLPKLEGSTEPLTDSSFASQTTTTPAQVRFMNFGIASGSSNLSKGVLISARLTYTCQFYARAVVVN